jgi:GAF domain-containing protein
VSEKDDEFTLTEPVLEAPPAPDAPASTDGTGSLFGADTFALAPSKLNALESMLTLLTRDYRFSDFTRELLMVFMKVVRSEAGSLLELDHEQSHFFFRAVVGQSSDRLPKFTVPIGKGIVGYVAESRQPLVVSDVNENQVHLRSIQQAVGFEARNLIAVPIFVRGKVYGVLELLNRVGEPTYTAQDVELLTYLCGVASRAIEVRLMLGWALSKGAESKRKAA